MEYKFMGNSEVKVAEGEKEMTFSGYGAYFGNIDSYGDVVQKGAFKEAVEKFESGEFVPAMLAQHGHSDFTPVGVYTKMYEDEKGLYVEGKLAPTERGKELYTLMKMKPRPAIQGLSIGYIATDVDYYLEDKATEVRLIKGVDLLEISIVTMPANDKALISDVKSDETATPRAAEKALKAAGYSDREAKKIVSIVKSAAKGAVKPEPEAESTDEKALREWLEEKRTGPKLTEEEKTGLSEWLAEEKKNEELRALRDLLAKK